MIPKRRMPRFTDEEVEILKANPFTSKVDHRHIWFTLDFQNIFEAGDTAIEIFTTLGYDVSILAQIAFMAFLDVFMTVLEAVGNSLSIMALQRLLSL